MTYHSTPIVQFGTSKFLQAHADLLFHEAGLERSVTVVAASGGASGEARLKGFNDRRGFPVHIQGREHGQVVDATIQVGSVAQGLSSLRDWKAVLEIAVNDAKYIVSNTTESGFDLPDDYVLDLSASDVVAPAYYPAKLLAILVARHRAGRAGITILPTELVTRNGDTLKAAVLGLAKRSDAGNRFIDWVNQECLFANSLVDRIVSEALDPIGAIAEPYALWAVEHQPGLEMPCIHPAIEVLQDLEPIQRLKLHILNLGHTFLGEIHLNEGRDENDTVYKMLSEPRIKSRLDAIYETEVLPGFQRRGLGEQAEDYIGKTMERFLNPFLNHRMEFVVKNHEVKVMRRIGDFLGWANLDGQYHNTNELYGIYIKYNC